MTSRKEKEILRKIKKSDEMYALADKCVISPGYEKFKIIGKTKTQIYGKQDNRALNDALLSCLIHWLKSFAIH